MFRAVIHNALITLLLSGSLLAGAQKNNAALTIKLLPVFGGEPLVLDEKWYITGMNDSVKIGTLKFYLSAIELKGKATTFTEKESYHIVDFDEKEYVEFTIQNITEGSYNRLNCAIGVDSLKNTVGALEGDLDPAKGMYWAWNTGYIAAKLEGESPSCKTKDHAFEFHIGGYRFPFNAYRTASIAIPSLEIRSSKKNELVLLVDVSTWFMNIELSSFNTIVEPDTKAMKIADNYRKMIRLQEGGGK